MYLISNSCMTFKLAEDCSCRMQLHTLVHESQSCQPCICAIYGILYSIC